MKPDRVVRMQRPTCALLALALGAVVVPARALADEALAARTWSSRIDYFNPGTVSTNLIVSYRKSDGTVFETLPTPVGGKASGSILVGTAVPRGFKGNGILSSDQPLAAVFRQQATGAAPSAAMLYSPLSMAEVGSGRFFVPEVRRGAAGATLVGVQNLVNGELVVALDFFSSTSLLKRTLRLPPVRPLASAIVNLATISALGRRFDGSLVIRASRADGGTPAAIAVAAETVPASGREAYAFSGMNGSQTTLLVPRVLCLPVGSQTLSSLLQVQNAGTTAARFVVSYYYPVTMAGRTSVRRAIVTSSRVSPGKRITVSPCGMAAVRGKKNVIAVIAGRNAAGQPSPIAAVVRWVNGGAGTQNANPAARRPAAGADGKYRVVFPSVEWGSTGARTTIDIMNATPRAARLAVPILARVRFYSPAGVLVKTVSRRVFTTSSIDPAAAGALVSGRFRGAVVVESGVPISAAARVQQVGYAVADGYAGVPW